MSDLPAPLTPSDCDLRDFGWMPLDIARLFGSEFHALSSDAEWRAGVTLWLRSYHQVPAASLPDDDVALARLAELGRDVKEWRKVKAGALRGWTRCSDGRLYHRTVAEKALEAWTDKLLQRKASAAGNAKRYGLKFDPVPFDDAVRDSLARLGSLNPGSRALSKRFLKAGIKATAGTPDDLPVGGGNAPGGSPETSRRDPDGTPAGTPDDLPVGSQLNRPEPNRTEPPIVPLTGGSPPTKRRRRARPAGELCPEDFKPGPTHYAKAAEWGRDAAWVDSIAERMRSWSQANANREPAWKANWSQALHDWLRDHRADGKSIIVRPHGPHPAASNGAAHDRPASGPAATRHGIAAGVAALLGGDPH